MLRRTKENFFSLGIILIITLLFMYSAIQLEFFESKIMPIFIGSMTIILLCLACYNEYTKIGCYTLSEDENSKKDISANDIKTLKCILPLFILTFLIYILGFYVATPIFLFAYMKISGSSLLSATIISVLAGLFIYIVFPILLETPLYTGILIQNFNISL